MKFLELKKVNALINQEIHEAVDRVLESGWYIMGNECRAFEKAFAKDLADRGFGVGCNSGTDAIELALLANGISMGDEVITVSHTAIPTVAAIVAIGAVPVFVDIDSKTWVMDVQDVKTKITDKTKAVVGVHLYGNMFDVIGLQDILKAMHREDIVVIEDTAQAHGASLNNCYAGSVGDAGAFSFYPSKNIGALGDGGAVFTKSKDVYEKLLMYRNYGEKDRYHALVSGGMNSRLDEIQAAVLSVKLKYLHQWNQKKTCFMEIYRDELKGLPLSFQESTGGCKPAWHQCVIKLDDDIKRDEFQRKLLDAGVQTLIHYPIPVHKQEAFQQYINASLPVTENVAAQILSLPFNYAMDEHDFLSVADRIKSCL